MSTAYQPSTSPTSTSCLTTFSPSSSKEDAGGGELPCGSSTPWTASSSTWHTLKRLTLHYSRTLTAANATMKLWMSACYWKAKQKSTSTHTATCHLTEAAVMFLHKRILLQQTSNTRNTRTLQETLKTNELKCQQLSGTRLVQIPRYRLQDNTKTRSSLANDVHPYVTNNQLESSVPLYSHQIRINPDMSTDLNTQYNSIWDMSQVSAAHDHDTSQIWGSSVS